VFFYECHEDMMKMKKKKREEDEEGENKLNVGS
jgi:hypothetical protein